MFSGSETVKKAAFVILCVLYILNITSCNRKDEIVIGLNYEGSGALAPYGKALLWGAELAVEEINASGGIDGRRVVLEKADNRSQGAESAAAVLYLCSVKDADVIIGPATSTLAKAALSVGADVLIISPSATADELTANTAPLVVSRLSARIFGQKHCPLASSINLLARLCVFSDSIAPFFSHRERSQSVHSQAVDDCANVCLRLISHRERSASLPSATADELTANTVGASKSPLCKGRWIAEQDEGIVNPSQSENAVSSNVGTSFLRLCFSDSVQGAAMGEYASSRGFLKAAVLVDMSSDYSVGCAAAFRKSFSGEIVFEGRFLSGDTDFSALVTELSKTDFDCVYLPAYYTEAGLFIRQSREQGIYKTFLGGDAMDSPYLSDVIGKHEYLHDIIYTDHFSYDEPRYKEFAERFFDRYGENPPAYSALAYDSVMLYYQNIQSVENGTFNTIGYQGVTGEIKIKENGDCEKEPVFVSLLEQCNR